jgi:hypothetical protein
MITHAFHNAWYARAVPRVLQTFAENRPIERRSVPERLGSGTKQPSLNVCGDQLNRTDSGAEWANLAADARRADEKARKGMAVASVIVIALIAWFLFAC